MNTFFELIQVAMGVRDKLSAIPQDRAEWEALYSVAGRHNLLAFTFPVIDRLHDEVEVPLGVYSRWAMVCEKIIQKNKRMNEACRQLYNGFLEEGFRSCILKGQAAAAYYPRPELRHCGDIDIWLEGGEKRIMDYIKPRYPIRVVFYHHCEVAMLKGINVEAHFMPSWMNSPLADRRLQKYFDSVAEEQFGHYDEALGFCVPARHFDAVYLLIHIYRHLLDEGIGLRQLLDYYYVLKALDPQDRSIAIADLKKLKLMKLAAGVMSVMKEVFNLDEELMLCPPDEKQGAFLIEEIMASGNFGRFDERNRHVEHEKRVMHARRKLTRAMRYLAYYPSEVLSIPVFMVRHYFWRLFRGYLQNV